MQSSIVTTRIQEAEAGEDWHALFTRHQHEKSVAQALSSKGHEVYLPLYRAVRRWNDRSKKIWLPLFSCYVFMRGGIERQLQILTTPGVLQIVGYGGRPAVVPASQLDAVRKMIQCSLPVEPHPYIQPGDPVRVIRGPLRGIEGVLSRNKGSVRLVISMEMLGRSVSADISSSDVAPILPHSQRASHTRICAFAQTN